MLAFERRWARAVLEAFAPPGAKGLAPEPGEIDYVVGYQQMLRASTRRAAFGARLALWIAALAPVWLWGKLRSVTRLDVQQRCTMLGELLAHRSFVVRELMMLLKMGASFALLGNERMRARSNYDRGVVPPWGERHEPEVARSGTRRRLAVVEASDVSEASG